MKYFLALFAFAGLFSLNSCNDDIILETSGEVIPVMYCILNPQDTVHYVKLNKSIDGASNSQTAALDPAQNYFDQVEIKIEEWLSNQLVRTWTLDDTLIENKNPGAFYYPEQKLYYFKTPVGDLNTNAEYRISAKINNGEFTISGTTTLVTGVSIVSPTNLTALTMMTSSGGNITYANTSVKANNGNAQVIEARIETYINEYIGATKTQKVIEWKLGEISGDQISGNQSTFFGNGQSYYTLLANNVTNDPAIDKRQIEKFRIKVTSGTEELAKFMALTQPSSSLAQTKPTYTNLKTSDGRRVVGIFSSRNSVVLEKLFFPNAGISVRGLEVKSTKELCTGPITGNLFFCSQHEGDDPSISSNGIPYCPN